MAEEAKRIRRLDDLKSLEIASFEKILGEVRAVARDKEEEQRLLTKRVLKDLAEFYQARKPQERHIAAPSFQTVLLARKAEKSAKSPEEEHATARRAEEAREEDERNRRRVGDREAVFCAKRPI